MWIFSLVALLVLATVVFAVARLTEPTPEARNDTAQRDQQAQAEGKTDSRTMSDKLNELDPADIPIESLLESTNAARAEKGIAALRLYEPLTSSAAEKCADMVTRDYWSHAVSGEDFATVIRKHLDPSFINVGENLNYGKRVPASLIVSFWSHSPSHAANLYSTDYQYVGFAVCESDNYVNDGNQLITVQHFAG